VTPGPKALETILKHCGIALHGTQIELLWRYHQLLRRANERLNLTRIHNFENMVLKHYVDSLLVLNFLALPSPLIDMGSGPGLPGIPLKIAQPELQIILAEPRGARAEFLSEVVSDLGLHGVEIYAHKLGPDYPGQVPGIISRAVGSIADTVERVATCLPEGGKMIFMKGPGCDDEIAEAAAAAAAFRQVADHAYEIPGTPHRRRLVIYERGPGGARRGARDDGRGATRMRAEGPRAEAAFTSQVREITSDDNPTFKHLYDLLGGAGIRKHGEAILAGPRICAEVLARFPEHVLGWISPSKGQAPPDDAILWLRLSNELFKQLDVAGTHAPLLLVRTPKRPNWSDEEPWPEGCTLFVPFQDPENVGAVIRSAAAFGASRVVLLREAAHPFHPRSSRAAGPALFQVALFQGPSLEQLRVRNAPLIALDTAGPELSESAFPDRFGLVVGVEGPGLPEHLRQGQLRRIAMRAGVESLNAATAAAIALYVWSRGSGGRDGSDTPRPSPRGRHGI
jgi:16S rRNA (guanine(527)-N(7))-methyltransferase RsmG